MKTKEEVEKDLLNEVKHCAELIKKHGRNDPGVKTSQKRIRVLNTARDLLDEYNQQQLLTLNRQYLKDITAATCYVDAKTKEAIKDAERIYKVKKANLANQSINYLIK